MKRLLALLLLILAFPALSQTISLSGANSRACLWSSTGSLVSDSGISYAGSGANLTLKLGTSQGLVGLGGYGSRMLLVGNGTPGDRSASVWARILRAGDTVVIEDAVGMGLGALDTITWTDPSTLSPGLTLSRADGWLAVGSVGTQGDTSGGAVLRLLKFSAGARPTCDASTRLVVSAVAGGDGVADSLAVCRKSADGSYSWADLY